MLAGQANLRARPFGDGAYVSTPLHDTVYRAPVVLLERGRSRAGVDVGRWINQSESRVIGRWMKNGGMTMGINYVFACLLVVNRDRAAAWYERFFGRPPDFLPNDIEAVWRVAETASVYLLADADRAGRGVVTLVVDDLDASLAEIAGRGISMGAIEEIPGAGRKSSVTDPDGNGVSLIEVLAAPAGEPAEVEPR
ncbi:MAG: hypothetical protein NVS4B2_34870 [Chloroflexota bacterium]